MIEAGALYVGSVVHKRLRPRTHALQYGVFSLLIDVDRIAEAAGKLRTFSYNRPNLVSFYDADHGSGEGTSVSVHAREILAKAGIAIGGGRILLLCYPRVMGYVFNPISVYYAFGDTGGLVALVYEVNNTFGERTSYVVRAGAARGGVYAHTAEKKMYVSPFAEQSGSYSFRVTPPEVRLLLAVLFRDSTGPLIKTFFKGEQRPLMDRQIMGLLVRFPFMTLKVMGAIHLEALKLWLKGIPLTQRRPSAPYSVAVVEGERKP